MWGGWHSHNSVRLPSQQACSVVAQGTGTEWNGAALSPSHAASASGQTADGGSGCVFVIEVCVWGVTCTTLTGSHRSGVVPGARERCGTVCSCCSSGTAGTPRGTAVGRVPSGTAGLVVEPSKPPVCVRSAGAWNTQEQPGTGLWVYTSIHNTWNMSKVKKQRVYLKKVCIRWYISIK